MIYKSAKLVVKESKQNRKELVSRNDRKHMQPLITMVFGSEKLTVITIKKTKQKQDAA